MIYVKHRTQCTGENDPNKQVSKDAWNEEHEIEGLGTAAEANVEDFEAAGAAAGAVAAHEAGNDPHPAYLKEAEADARYAAAEHVHAPSGVTMAQVIDTLYPVGALYTSTLSTSPATLLGRGTWAAWGAGRVMVGHNAADTDFEAAEKTGGAKTVTLTGAQSGLPQHTHLQNAHTHVQDPHSHVITSQTATTGGATSYEHGTLDTSSAEAEATETTVAATAVNQNATAVNQNAGPANAAQAHENMPPFIVAYVWKRTA